MNIAGCENTEYTGTVLRNEVQVLAPISSSGKEDFKGNFYFLHNKGNTVLTIDKGLTIMPGETWSMGNPGTYDYIEQSFDLQFGNTNVVIDPVQGVPVGPPVNRVEVVRYIYSNQNA